MFQIYSLSGEEWMNENGTLTKAGNSDMFTSSLVQTKLRRQTFPSVPYWAFVDWTISDIPFESCFIPDLFVENFGWGQGLIIPYVLHLIYHVS